MSKGPGVVEKRIAELFAASRDRPLTVTEITDHAFDLGGQPPTRAQRLSATRAAHRVLRRVREAEQRAFQLYEEAHRNAKAALGRDEDVADNGEYQIKLRTDPAWQRAEKLSKVARQLGIWRRYARHGRGDGAYFRVESSEYWRATTAANGTLYFHAPDAPVRVWAVSIQPAGVIWADAEVTRITERNVMVRYAGENARLNREDLWRWWAFWRGVRFASSRTGRIAAELDRLWQERYGHAAGGVPPIMQMPLADAMALLGVPADYTRDDVITAFRREAKKAHPDAGGTAEQFRQLVEARDRLLAALGTSAPPPKMPTYAPKGVQMVYRRVSIRSQQRLG